MYDSVHTGKCMTDRIHVSHIADCQFHFGGKIPRPALFGTMHLAHQVVERTNPITVE